MDPPSVQPPKPSQTFAVVFDAPVHDAVAHVVPMGVAFCPQPPVAALHVSILHGSLDSHVTTLPPVAQSPI